MAIKLRSYQLEAIESIYKYFRSNSDGHPLVAAPTGSGKSHILAGFCAKAYKLYPKERILILTHTKEIIRQDAKILRDYIPSSLVGIYSSGLSRRQIRQFTVASIQSVYKRADEFNDFRLIIVDEAHLIPPDGEGRYRTFLGKLPKARVLGLTATPFRRGHGLLTEGHLFDRVIYDIEVQMLIDKGYLAPLSTKATEYALNTRGLKVIGGDYSKKELSSRLDHTHITSSIIKEIAHLKDVRKSWLIFAIDIEHCEHIAAELNKAGIVAVAVHSKLDFDRQHLLDLFKAGHVQAIVSVETLTTGFDAPNVDMIVLMRPTQSPVLHVQMLGRGMRINEGKTNCLVLDFAGNVRRLGPVDEVLIKAKGKKGKGKGTGFTRVCPKCSEIVHVSKQVCPACGYAFPKPVKLSTSIDEAAILKKDKENIVKIRAVTTIRFSKHKKAGKPPSFKVTYKCGGLAFYNEWIAFEHEGYPKTKAHHWWAQHAQLPVPTTVDEALKRRHEIRTIRSIKVEQTGKWPTIIGYYYA